MRGFVVASFTVIEGRLVHSVGVAMLPLYW